MPKRRDQEKSVGNQGKNKPNSRISRACDRCQHRKLACDMNDHSCQQCHKASTWCTATDHLTQVPAYRGQFAYLERAVEDQKKEIQLLLDWLRGLGQDVSRHEYQDSETQRYEAWKYARHIEPSRPWDKEDQQANLTMDRVIQDKSRKGPTDLCLQDNSSIPSSLPAQQDTSTFMPEPTSGFPMGGVFQTSIELQGPPDFSPDFDGFDHSNAFTTEYCPFKGALATQMELDYDMNRARI